MELQPPWASELLARNRKVARNICWSTSLDSSSGINDSGRDVVVFASSRTNSYDGSRGKGTMVKREIAAYTLAREGGKVVDPVGVSSSSTYNRTEKSDPILDEVAAEAAGLDMKGKSGEESFLEYGPGIVRKLRSRYQSLALRQSLGRPTLRRAASLENCLDSVSSEPLSSESPSPVPYYEDEVDGDHGKRSSHHWSRSETNTVLIYNNVNTAANNNNGIAGNRGRSGYNDYSRKDRMRRARSVDALHRPKRHMEEKEILEKLTVVLPKEEIVIIEVSKPHSNLSNGNYNIGIEDKPQQHLYPRSLQIHTTASATNGYSGNSSEINRVRSVTSPEHELPPPDIVRETARIFEKNQDTHNNCTSPVNNLLISNVKKVGHALRLSKSSSSSPNSSPLPSPTTASQTNSPTITSMMSGQGGKSYHSQNKGHLSDQGLTTTSTTILNHKAKTQESNQRNLSATNGVTFNSKSTPSSNYSGSHPHSKQIGVIRPTVTNSATGTGLTSSSVKGVKINSEKTSVKSVPSPEVSPIPPNNFASVNPPQIKKPPLGPKPMFTSSPKPTTLLASNKTGSPNLTDTPIPNGTHPKSPTEEPLKNIFESENRMKSPTEPLSSAKIIGSMNNKQNIPTMAKSSIEIPKEKENDVMEFQQITLKHVAKQKDHTEVILNNGTSKNSSNNIPKTLDSTKTEKRKDEKSNANLNYKITNASSNQKIAPAIIAATTTTTTTSAPPTVTPVSPIPKVTEAPKPKQDQQQSQLRTHQKQKLEKQKSSGGETMVFNFTKRKSVPDYIEDDGLHKVKLSLGGTVTDESNDDDSELNTFEQVDSRLITFEGANVIINGRSSIQKKPKSQKLNISFNEEAPTTFEYPSEASVSGEDDVDNKDNNPLGQKTPNITNGSGLGSYTPSKLGNSYQLGNYTDRVVVTKKPSEKKQDNSSELIEDYLKPDTGSTTWSSEIGAADILF